MAAMARKVMVTSRSRVQKLIPHLLSLFFFLFATVCITLPLLTSPTNRITGLGDELLVTWIMNWNFHALLTDPTMLFQANIFYPYQNTLAYSDLFLTGTLIGSIPYLFFQEPVIFFNANLVFSLLTLGFFTYLLTYYLTKHYFAAFISGVLMAFSTFTLTKIAVLQLISIQWIPLSLLFFFMYIKEKKFRYFLLTCLFFLIQTYNSFLPGYFLFFSSLLISLVFLLRKNASFSLFFNRNSIITGLITGLLLLPIILPYYAVSREFQYTRDIRDTIHFANRPEYTFYPSEKTRLQDILLQTVYRQDTGPYKYDGYLGFVFFLLLFFSIFYSLRKRKADNFFLAFGLIGLFSFILSLGPALQWGGKVIKEPFLIPLPYALFYYVIPGFNGLRNSGRWEMLTVFALSIIIGLSLAYILNRQRKLVQIGFTVVISVLILAEYPFPLPSKYVPRKEEFPATYTYISSLPDDAAIIELPLYSWNMGSHAMDEFMREYYSTRHFHKMVNGYSGFSPPAWEKQALDLMFNFPDENTIHNLKRQGVDYMILHKKEYDRLETERFIIIDKPVQTWRKIKPVLDTRQDIVFVTQINNDYIYKIK